MTEPVLVPGLVALVDPVTGRFSDSLAPPSVVANAATAAAAATAAGSAKTAAETAATAAASAKVAAEAALAATSAINADAVTVDNLGQATNTGKSLVKATDAATGRNVIDAATRSYQPINVKDYGALGNGTANDTAAFVSARAAAIAQGRALYIPAGTYKVDPDTLTDWAGACITGASMQRTQLFSSGAADIGVGIAVTNSHTEISGIEIRGFREGLRISVFSVRIHDNLIQYNLVGIHLPVNSYLGRIHNNNVTFNRGIGILVGQVNYQLTISHNIIDNNKGIGVGVYGSSGGVIISDNSIEGNREYTSGLGCGLMIAGAFQARLKIDGNWFESNGTTDQSVDLLFKGPPEQTEYIGLWDNLVTNNVPAAYQTFFTSAAQSGAGMFSITRNYCTFTKYSMVVSGGAVGVVAIRENQFKGRLDVFNKHICINANSGYLGLFNIEDNGYRNTDNAAIDAQVTTGVNGTIVQTSMTGPQPKLRYNGGLLFPASATGADIQVFTTSGTWTKPAGAVLVRVVTIGAGGGGGSGRRGAAGTVRCGGGGGGGGGMSTTSFDASLLPATVAVTVGAGGVGGAAVTADDTNGNNGTSGGSTTFGTYLRGGAGSGGLGGTVSSGGAGNAGGGFQLGGVGSAASATGAVGASAGNILHPAASGGAGGGGITSANVASNGGGGVTASGVAVVVANGGVVDTTAPQPGAATTANLGTPGGSGGGGAASITTAAQTGGAGGIYGAAGSGGGASLNGNNSGAGGAGAAGITVVITT